MSLLPALVVFFAVLLFAAASGQQLQDAGLLASQQADRALAWRRAEAALARSAASMAEDAAGLSDDVGDDADDADGANVSRAFNGADGPDAAPRIETLPSAADSELGELPLSLQRVTAAGKAGMTRVRLQADYAVDGCESADDESCISRVRRIAWRQLPPD